MDKTKSLNNLILIHPQSHLRKWKLLCWSPIFYKKNKNPFLLLSHIRACWEGPRAKQPSSVSCSVLHLWIMAEGGRRCSSSKSGDKLSLLDARVPTVPLCSCGHTNSMATAELITLPPSGHATIYILQGGSPEWSWYLARSILLTAFFFLPPPSFSILLFFFFFVRFISDEKVFGFFLLRCSNLNSFLLSALPSQGRPRGVVHILPPYCVSSFSLWHRTIPPEYPAFCRGAGENAWLTPFCSVYSKVPRQSSHAHER